MDVSIEARSEMPEAELRSLATWLSQEADLRASPVSWAPPALRPGEMGGMADVLIVTLGSGGAGAVLAQSISLWLKTRVTELRLKISTEYGSVELDARNMGDAEALIERVAALRPGAPDTGRT